MLYSIKHKTIFEFETAPESVFQRLHLTPLANSNQKIVQWDIAIEGGSIELNAHDYHGNCVLLCQHSLKSNIMKIVCSGEVEVKDTNGIVGMHDNSIPLALFNNFTPLTNFGPFTKKLKREILNFQASNNYGELDVLHELSSRISKKIQYTKGQTNIDTTAEMALKLGLGVCQDHVHAFLSVTRLLGFKSRYASGYLMMNDNTVQEASHAWAEVYVSNLGWVGFDVSNGISPNDQYVKLATGFDFSDVTPFSGIRYGDGNEKVSTRITIHQQ